MKKSTKAALLSALAFPGCGHLLLKCYVMAFLLTGISLTCIGWIAVAALHIAQEITDQIVNGQIPLNAPDIMTAITQAEATARAQQSTVVSTYLLIACWVFGTADSFRLGRAQEKVGQ